MQIEDVPGHPDYRPLASIEGIGVELRYATPNNFAGRDLYGSFDGAWLHREAAEALQRSVAWLRVQRPGWRLLVLDALRPHRVQLQLWDVLAPLGLQRYLADPARGSIHSFGMAVDVTLLDEAGRELDMGTAFDELDERSHPAHEARYLAEGRLSAQAVQHRELLRSTMAAGGFRSIDTEWWHFDCGDREHVRRTMERVD
jgi:D-alanyl-D-alanine dipeptidase